MKHRKVKRKRRPAPSAVFAAVALGLLILAGAGLYRRALAPVSADTRTQLVYIPRSGVKELAELLKEKGLIRSVWAFRLLAQSSLALNPQKPPQAGYYDLSPSMAADEILARLCEGKVARRKITFPEGFTLAQMATRLQEVLNVPEQAFLAAAQGACVTRALPFKLPRGSLEGYLFPSTYIFNVGEKPGLIVSEMLATFNEQFVKPYQHEIASQKLSLHELVTIASLVEREAKKPQERALIAGVIMNRLQRGMKLQIDATVQYALGKHKRRLLYRDLKTASPYNTYKHAGLPPGPICNPGLDCLLAALRPARTEALYYVARGDGTHIFSRTYEEHVQAIKQIRGKK